MSNPTILPDQVRDIDDLARIEQAASRREVPSGGGVMVWHCWGEGLPVVLLHGGSGSWNHWVRNIAALVDDGRQVWVPDLPGFGESARPPGGADADAVPAPLEAALQALLGDRAVDLVGFSFGAMVGGLLAAQRPERVARLVLVGAPALGVKPAPQIVLRGWNHLQPGAEFDAVQRANLARLMLADPQAIDELSLAIQALNLPRDRMKMRRISRTEILKQSLPAIRCPVYGIWGAEDALYRGVQAQLEPALREAPDFRWLQSIAQAGHWVQYEAAGTFNLALSAALRG